MKDFIEVDNRLYRYTLVQKEIRFKGKAYISVREARECSALAAADIAAVHLEKNGAREIYFTCRDNTVLVPDIFMTPAGRTFRHVYDMDWLEMNLTCSTPTETSLSLQPIDTRNHGAFRHVYNECFFGVPNGATYTRADVRKLLEPEREGAAGVILEGGQAVGIYELTFGEKPGIDALGIISEKRGAGYGRQALALLLEKLWRRGGCRAGLLVCTANENGYGLYIKAGFSKKCTQSRWYRMD